MSEYPDNPGKLPAEKLCNKYNNPNPIKGEGALGNENTGKMYHEGNDRKSLVETLQKMLRDLKKYDLGSSGPNKDGVDGTFGNSTEDAVKQFQEEHKDWDSNVLKVDGLVGPETADALNREMVGKWYDHYQTHEKLVEGVPHHAVTSEFLSKGLSVETKGAKKSRVFIIGVIPTKTYNELRIRLHNHMATPMTNVQYKLVIGETIVEDFSKDGWIVVEYPDNADPKCRVEWGDRFEDGTYPYKMEVVLDCSNGDEKQQAIGKLHNLGYLIDSSDQNEYERIVKEFQANYHIKEKGLLPTGSLPPKTKTKLWSIYEDKNCNASRT